MFSDILIGAGIVLVVVVVVGCYIVKCGADALFNALTSHVP